MLKLVHVARPLLVGWQKTHDFPPLALPVSLHWVPSKGCPSGLVGNSTEEHARSMQSWALVWKPLCLDPSDGVFGRFDLAAL